MHWKIYLALGCLLVCRASREVLDYPSLLSDKLKQPYKPKLFGSKTYKCQFTMLKQNLKYFNFSRKLVCTFLSFEQYSETVSIILTSRTNPKCRNIKESTIYLSKYKCLFLNNNILLSIQKHHYQHTLNEFGAY